MPAPKDCHNLYKASAKLREQTKQTDQAVSALAAKTDKLPKQ